MVPELVFNPELRSGAKLFVSEVAVLMLEVFIVGLNWLFNVNWLFKPFKSRFAVVKAEFGSRFEFKCELRLEFKLEFGSKFKELLLFRLKFTCEKLLLLLSFWFGKMFAFNVLRRPRLIWFWVSNSGLELVFRVVRLELTGSGWKLLLPRSVAGNCNSVLLLLLLVGDCELALGKQGIEVLFKHGFGVVLEVGCKFGLVWKLFGEG